MSTDIIVTGKRYNSTDGSYTVQSNLTSYTGGGGNVYTGGGNTASNPSTPSEHTASVNVHVTNSSHYGQAVDAATHIADALTLIEDLLDKSPANAQFYWDGIVYTPAQLRAEINNTQFIVDDQASYSNGGVGSAERGQNGNPNVDHLNYWAFTGANASGYAAPGYGGQGVAAMLLHEIGHMTEAGLNQSYENNRVYIADYGPSAHAYNGSLYWQNNENFAHDLQAAAQAMGLNVSNYESAVGSAQQYGS